MSKGLVEPQTCSELHIETEEGFFRQEALQNFEGRHIYYFRPTRRWAEGVLVLVVLLLMVMAAWLLLPILVLSRG